MIKELYINNVLVDIKEISIIRKYTSPLFSDCTNVYKDGTYTVSIPKTQKNLSALGYFDRADSQALTPYRKNTASYYVNGLPIFENAECLILSDLIDIELQFTWGISRDKYIPLFTKKLNEIKPNGTTILESDWLVTWNKTDMFASGKKYKYIDYESAELVQDVETINGVKQSPAEAPEPYKSNLKEMTLHPFIEYNNIIDLICADNGIDNSEFASLKERLTNMGLILGGDDADKDVSVTQTKAETIVTVVGRAVGCPIPSLNELVTASYDKIKISTDYLGLTGFKFKLSFKLTTNKPIAGISITENGSGFTPVTTSLLFTTVNNTTHYTTTFEYELEQTDANQGHDFSVSIMPKYSYPADVTPYTFTVSNELKVDYTIQNAYYGLSEGGLYDCLMNLHQLTQMDFIKAMLIKTGMRISYDSDGNIKLCSFSDLTNNYEAKAVNDWSGRVKVIDKTTYKFNSNAKKNWIKYNNSDDIKYTNKGFIEVDDTTIETEKDLYKLPFNLGDKAAGGEAELLLYTVTIKKNTTGTSVTTEFDITYNSKESISVYNDNGIAKNEQVLPNDTGGVFGFISKYYPIYKKLVSRPVIKPVEINLDFYESANIDLLKPVYVKEWGRYGIILDLTCPDDEVSVANILLVDDVLKTTNTTEVVWSGDICEKVYTADPVRTPNLIHSDFYSSIGVHGNIWKIIATSQYNVTSDVTVTVHTDGGNVDVLIASGTNTGEVVIVLPTNTWNTIAVSPTYDSTYNYNF